MTRLKSAYRPKPFKDGGRVTDDVVKSPAAETRQGNAGGGVGSSAYASDAPSASDAFQVQIGNLRRAEEAQRQRAANPRFEQLRQQGLTESTISFLSANPEIANNPFLADQAARLARNEGHIPDTEPFFRSVADHFSQITAPAASADSDLEPYLETAQKYIGGVNGGVSVRDTADLERDQFNRSAAMVSAPVSREVPSSNREDRPLSRVTLSVAEKGIARSMGISDVEYAKGKLELERRKRDGEI